MTLFVSVDVKHPVLVLQHDITLMIKKESISESVPYTRIELTSNENQKP